MRGFQCRFIAAALLGLVLGCVPQSPLNPPSPLPTPTICQDGTCGPNCSGTECTPEPNDRVHLEVDPAAAGYIPQLVLDVSISQDLSNIQLKRRSFFYGNLVASDLSRTATSGVTPPSRDDILAIIPDIIAIPQAPEDLSKNAASFMINRQNNLSATIDRTNGNFTLALVADQKYQIVVNPQGQNGIAPTFFPAQIGMDFNASIALSSRGSVISGELLFANFNPSDLAGKISVRILQGQQTVSSVGKLTSRGTFSVQLSAPLYREIDANHRLILVAEPDESFAYLPTIREKLELGANDLIDRSISVKTIELLDSSRPRETTLSIVGDDEKPVNDARIYLKGKTGEYYSEVQLESDINGQAQSKLMNGVYKLAVVPPPDSPYGMYHDAQFVVENGVKLKSIVLPQRKTVEGVLLDYNDRPVQGALIQLTRFAREDSNRPETVLRDTPVRIEARTDENGRWCTQPVGAPSGECPLLRLDDGRYRLLVIPPPGAELPFFTRTFDFPEKSSLSIKLKKPRRVTGKIISPAGLAPVENAFVKIFSRTIELESGEPFLLGQAITQSGDGKKGQFTIFISPE